MQEVTVGSGPETRSIAFLQRAGSTPGLFWINGFRSLMSGDKASAVDAFGAERGLSVTRFDHAGLGHSSGDFNDSTVSRWLEESLAVFARTSGPQIVIGSSMGGWLALLLARAVLERGTPLKGLILIAPAVDATSTLIPARMGAAERQQLDSEGFFERVSAYGDGAYRYSKALIEDGNRHSLFGKAIETGCPIHILQGGQDVDVPPAHAQRLLTHLLHDPVSFTLIPDGDHRLSRPEDILRLRQAIEAMLD